MRGGDGQLPSGVVTFVVTDLEGSTRLLRSLGDRYVDVLERHRQVLRRAWAQHRGHEVDASGDGFLVVFDDAVRALDACATGQQLLAEQAWPGGAPVRVRMGVHTGLAAPLAGRYVAMAVHQAARIAGTAHGGQVIASEQTGEQLPAQVAADRLVALGRFRVRDFDQPVQLHQLAVPGLPRDVRPPRCVPAERHNIGVPPTTLVGREADLAAVRDLVAAHRLVTVVGTGGVGKTRLAAELAVTTAERWRDGVWMLECATVDDPDRLPDAVARLLGVDVDGGCRTAEELCTQLLDRRTVLVLDGCEGHVRAIAALSATVLRRCPGMKILATCTEPLRAPGEVLYRLGPLSTDGGIASPAAVLFRDRARAVRPRLGTGVDPAADPATDSRESAAIVSLCRQLDGLPLALEIAAARMTVLTAEEILAGMSRRFQLLRSSDRSRPRRQRGLDALLDWSFQLLTEAELQTLWRVSLLVAPFDLAAATAAVAADHLADDDVPELVWSLADKSLLVADSAAGATRYRSLETVRSYAREQLRAHGQLEGCAARLADFFAARLGPAVIGGRSWVHAVAADLDNVRSVLGALPPSAAGRAQELAVTIARYHAAVQSFRVGVAEVTRLADQLEAPTPGRVGLLTALGDLHVRTGDVDAAERLAGEAASLRRRLGRCPWDEVGVDKLLGDVALVRGRVAEAAMIARQALRSPLSARDRARMANLLGIAEATAGRQAAAVAAFSAELEAAVETRDEVLLAHAHSNSAEIALRGGDSRSAAVHLRLCLSLAVALGQTGMIAYTLIAAARLAAPDWLCAVRLIARAEVLLRESGLALYDTDSRVTEEFLLSARERLGPARYAEAMSAGQAQDTETAVTDAEQVLDAVAAVRDRRPLPHIPELEVRP